MDSTPLTIAIDGRHVTVDPDRDWARLAVNPRAGGNSTEWRFWIDGEAITIETGTGESEDREALARALASALGWDFPQPDELHQAA